MDFFPRLFWTLLGTASLCYFAINVALGYWKRRGILHEKPKKPWGHLKGVGRKRHISEVLQSLYDKYKGQAPFVGFYAVLKPMLLILDLESIHYILLKDSKYFMDRGLYYNIQDDILSQNQLQMDGPDWQHMNLKLKSLQWQEKIQKMLPALLKVQQTFANSLKDQIPSSQVKQNITELVEGFNIDCISSLAFGLEGDSLRYRNTQFHNMSKAYTKRNFNIFKAYLAFCFPSLARLLQYYMYSPEATQYFQKLISDKLNEREYQHTQSLQYDFLQLWCDSRKISQRNQMFKKFENQEIVGQAFSFILAGLESSTSTLACCLYEMALQPEIQNKARKEIQEVLGANNGKINEDTLKDLIYLKQILNETLRKHSPYPFLLRLTTKDYELPNSVFMLQQGNHLIIPISAIHNDSTYYPNPDKFDPEHFHSTAVEKRPACAFLPYGMGPRACIAQYFIQQQMLLCLVTLLQRYAFTTCEETTIPLTYDNAKLLKKPKNDIWLAMEKL
ncbi:probable cytochrome P450 6u1 [Musca vetustissima]|uniref:probable cytochrome P450 6u1 n=1 Tax=Musca vetustissima TaxID=27455 RepID=UPI002AB7DD94|nr:probable cytochrome P450 6u1 [Musca vetustissima]